MTTDEEKLQPTVDVPALVAHFGKITQERRRMHSPERALFLLLEMELDNLPSMDAEYGPGCFHKAFRQTNVTRSGSLDMAIWHLLGASELFLELADTYVAALKLAEGGQA